MKGRRGVLGGRKVSARHSTYVESAERVIRAAKASPSVRRVVLGEIKPSKNGRQGLKCQEIPAGLRVKVRSPRACQEIFYTDQPATVAAELEGLF